MIDSRSDYIELALHAAAGLVFGAVAGGMNLHWAFLVIWAQFWIMREFWQHMPPRREGGMTTQGWIEGLVPAVLAPVAYFII